MRVYNENRTDFEASGFCPNTTLLSQIQHINVHIIIKSQMNKQSKIRRRVGGANKHSNSSEKMKQQTYPVDQYKCLNWLRVRTQNAITRRSSF